MHGRSGTTLSNILVGGSGSKTIMIKCNRSVFSHHLILMYNYSDTTYDANYAKSLYVSRGGAIYCEMSSYIFVIA